MLTLALTLAGVTTIQSATVLDAYLSCVRANALVLEKSGETAPVVAEVVVGKCDRLVEPLYAEFLRDFRERPEIKKYEMENGRPLNFDNGKQQTIDGFHKSARSLAIQTIVEARAKKASKK